jgi:hypothetical protein
MSMGRRGKGQIENLKSWTGCNDDEAKAIVRRQAICMFEIFLGFCLAIAVDSFFFDS